MSTRKFVGLFCLLIIMMMVAFAATVANTTQGMGTGANSACVPPRTCPPAEQANPVWHEVIDPWVSK